MCKDLESSALSASLVAILRRIELLALVILVMGGKRALSIAHQAVCFPMLSVKHSNRKKEKRVHKDLSTYCPPGLV